MASLFQCIFFNYLICSVTSTCGNTRSGAIIDDIIDLQRRMVRLEGLVDSGELTGPVGPQGEQGPQFTMVRTWRDLPTMVVSGKDIVDNIIGKIGTSAPGWTIYIPTHEDVKLCFAKPRAYQMSPCQSSNACFARFACVRNFNRPRAAPPLRGFAGARFNRLRGNLGERLN